MDSVDLLEYMRGLPVVKVVIPTATTSVFMECKIVSFTSSFFEIELLPHQAEINDLDFSGNCAVSCTKAGEVFIINARIELVLSENRLRLIALEVASQPQQRGFFRVDAVVYLKFWLVEKGNEGSPKVVHQKINISGNGLRFTTEKPLQVGQLIGLELCLPDVADEGVQGVGRVVRVVAKDRNLQEAALELVELEESEQDKIIGFCLAEQRKQLRMRVHVI